MALSSITGHLSPTDSRRHPPIGEITAITLHSPGTHYINDSHIIVKRETTTPNSAEITGIYSTPGSSHFNTTHIVKTSNDSQTTAVLSAHKEVTV